MKCTKCGETLVKTDYRPPDGLDPRLRGYVCTKGHREYKLISKTDFYNEWLSEKKASKDEE